MKKILLIPAVLLLAACGSEVPKGFAAPAAERERLEDELDARCTREREGYWFCSAEQGVFHVFTEQSRHAGEQVRQVMLDRSSDGEFLQEAVALYGFTPEQLQQVRNGDSPAVVAGSFRMRLDATWNEPVIELDTADVRAAANDGK